MKVSTIGLDIAKRVFRVHGADTGGNVVFRKKIARANLIRFSPHCPPAWWQWRRVAARTTGPVN